MEMSMSPEGFEPPTSLDLELVRSIAIFWFKRSIQAKLQAQIILICARSPVCTKPNYKPIVRYDFSQT